MVLSIEPFVKICLNLIRRISSLVFKCRVGGLLKEEENQETKAATWIGIDTSIVPRLIYPRFFVKRLQICEVCIPCEFVVIPKRWDLPKTTSKVRHYSLCRSTLLNSPPAKNSWEKNKFGHIRSSFIQIFQQRNRNVKHSVWENHFRQKYQATRLSTPEFLSFINPFAIFSIILIAHCINCTSNFVLFSGFLLFFLEGSSSSFNANGHQEIF